jgi:hypothetical protein
MKKLVLVVRHKYDLYYMTNIDKTNVIGKCRGLYNKLITIYKLKGIEF